MSSDTSHIYTQTDLFTRMVSAYPRYATLGVLYAEDAAARLVAQLNVLLNAALEECSHVDERGRTFVKLDDSPYTFIAEREHRHITWDDERFAVTPGDFVTVHILAPEGLDKLMAFGKAVEATRRHAWREAAHLKTA